jgi:WD40 repeat protein
MIAELPFASAEPDSFPPHIAATKDGLVFMAGKNDKVDAMDAGTRAVRYRLAGHGEGASAVTVSESAGLVATATGEKKPRVMLWRLAGGEKIAELEPPGRDRVDALAFSRDGAQLAISVGGSLHFYAVADKRLTRTLVIHPFGAVFAAAFTADGKQIISCQDHPILWDLATGKMVHHFGPFIDLCHSVDVSPDGRFAVTSSMGSDVRVWEIATGKFHRQLGINVHPPH